MIMEFNNVLTGEATRLNLDVPTLPDPKSTAQSITDLLVNASTAVVDSTSPYANRVDSADELAASLRFDMLKEAYNVENDLTRTLGVNPITDPEAAQAKVEGMERDFKNALDGGEFDRELEEAAGMLGGLGVVEYSTKDGLKSAIDAGLDDADKILTDSGL